MGRKFSKHLDKPWREINWDDREVELKHMRNYETRVEGQQIRVLLHGLSGAGKSSFINTVQTVLNGRLYRQALANNSSCGSFTRKYRTFPVQKHGNTFYPFVFNDIMGMESTSGVLVEDVELALMGNIKEGYQFNTLSKLSEDNYYYNDSPDFNDRVHVLVLVLSAETLAILTEDIIRKIQKIRATASDRGIPQVAILTKIDSVFPELRRELRRVYKLQGLKEMMERLSVVSGIPMNCIFAQKNYHEEISPNNDIDSLTLNVFKHIITCADDYLNFLQHQSDLEDKSN